MYARVFDIREIVRHRSIFLLGPRQTGKSTLVRAAFPEAAVYDLLEADTFRDLSARPESLRQTLKPQHSVVIVDESSIWSFWNSAPSWITAGSITH